MPTPDEAPKNSLHALTGVRTSENMQVKAHLGDQEFIALIDSGSTHNFLSADAIRQLALPLELRDGMRVVMANGERATCSGFSMHTSLTIDKEAFIVDFYIIPLGGYVIILGTRWLVTLGPILWDFGSLTMTFWCGNHQVTWRGITGSSWSAQAHNCTAYLFANLLAAFDDVFAEPCGLPPPRRQDHCIHLRPSTEPVVVRSYRYPALQKDKLERQ